MCSNKKSKRGFTILELVISIAIIGILAAVVMVLLSNAQEKSRDARRMNDMKQIESGLNLYSTNKGHFPVEEEGVIITGSDRFSDALITSGAMDAVPSDPVSSQFEYTYQTNAEGSTYTITFCLETNTVKRFDKGCGNTITP